MTSSQLALRALALCGIVLLAQACGLRRSPPPARPTTTQTTATPDSARAAARPPARPAAGTPAPAQPPRPAALAPGQLPSLDSSYFVSPVQRRRSPVHLVLMGEMHRTQLRTSVGGGAPSDESVAMTSLDFQLQPARSGGLGIAGRLMSGGDDVPTHWEGSLLLGARRFALDLGYAVRSGYDPAGGGLFDTTYAFGKGGFRARANLGNTDFSMKLRGAYYVEIPTADEPATPAELEGWEGETGLAWTWNRFPLTVTLGYRIERFKVFDREQEVSSLVLGGGLLLGRR
jgi:hypothetical protein